MPELAQMFVTKTSGNWYNRLFAEAISWCTAVKTPTKRSWKTLWRSYTWVESPINHTGGYIGNGEIVQAARVVEFSSADEYSEATWITLPENLRPTKAQQERIAQFWMAQRGKKYNWIDILTVGLAQKRFGSFLHWISKWPVEKRLSSGSTFMCSQLMDAGYLAAGIDLFPDSRPDGLVSPEDLRELSIDI